MAFSVRDQTTSQPGGIAFFAVRAFFRFIQFVLAITVIGLYGANLDEYNHDSRWGYGVAVGVLAAITVLVYCVPFFKTFWTFIWDFVMFILWAALFGVFRAQLYAQFKAYGRTSMINAMWIDCVNMVLWFVTFCLGIAGFFLARRGGKTMHTGRANA